MYYKLLEFITQFDYAHYSNMYLFGCLHDAYCKRSLKCLMPMLRILKEPKWTHVKPQLLMQENSKLSFSQFQTEVI